MKLFEKFLVISKKIFNFVSKLKHTDINEIVSIISNVGFPIAVCDKHKEEIDKLSETLQGNTKVLTELCTLIKTLVK